MLFNLVNLLIIIIILLVLNYIKINKKNKDELTNIVHTNSVRTPNDKIPLYGDIQYGTNNEYFDIKYEDDLDEIKPDNYFELTKKIGDLGEKQKPIYNDIFKKSNQQKNKFNNFELEDPELLPSQQNIVYDTYKKFNQPSDNSIYNPLVPSQIDYKDRKIQDVYDQMINNPKRYEKNKKISKYRDPYNKYIIDADTDIKNESTINGGFQGEHTLSNLTWEYEEDNDGMSYDPSLSNLMSL
jgi:hypothetical protein